jgi:hypothetical protein
MIDPRTVQQFLQFNRLSYTLSGFARHMELTRFREEELAKPRHSDPKRLLRYGFKVYSQCDEDGIIHEIFNRIGVGSRTFIEFGVHNGAECNTAMLLLAGWRGLWLESLGVEVAQMRRDLATFIQEGRLKVVESRVTAENVNTLFERAGFAGEIDLLSIDIDYNDYWVWKAIDIVKPRVVVIEYNATLRPPLSLVVPYAPAVAWNGTSYFGASLEALVRLGGSKGYRLVGCTISGVNAFFVRDDLCGDRFLEPATAEEHYEPARYFFSAMIAGHPPALGHFLTV